MKTGFRVTWEASWARSKAKQRHWIIKFDFSAEILSLRRFYAAKKRFTLNTESVRFFPYVHARIKKRVTGKLPLVGNYMSAMAGRALVPIFLHSCRHGGIYLEKVYYNDHVHI